MADIKPNFLERSQHLNFQRGGGGSCYAVEIKVAPKVEEIFWQAEGTKVASEVEKNLWQAEGLGICVQYEVMLLGSVQASSLCGISTVVHVMTW